MTNDPKTGLAGRTKALERMAQERDSPGRDTAGGDATHPDFEGTAPRRKDAEREPPSPNPET